LVNSLPSTPGKNNDTDKSKAISVGNVSITYTVSYPFLVFYGCSTLH